MAIDELLDEHEQGERVREWLRRNGSALVFGIALGLGAIGGWQWWQGHRASKQQGAATEYQAAVDAIRANDTTAAAKVQALPEGPFRVLAQLELARAQVEGDQVPAAIQTLRAIRTGEPALAAIVNQRLARLLIESGKPDEAVRQLPADDSLATLEVRGDAQMALGRREEARESYRKALLKAEVGSPQRSLLELKLAEAGGTPPNTESQS